MACREARALSCVNAEDWPGHVLTILEDLETQQSLLLNSAMLLLTSIGDDHFFLNKIVTGNTYLLDFETVYDLNDFEY